MKSELYLISEWLRKNKLGLNSKTKFMIFDNMDQLDTIDIVVDGITILTIKEEKLDLKNTWALL